ncbi:MAG TPA: hypothetical protein VGQ75_08180 [Thermoanaerobaculia bacterium]|jgi:hypothetical protein|nr:hypothetical protein [Thermoanaerobaculia bacterium]
MSSQEEPILFQALVLCDDVRFENNGKLLLIGVYSDVVQVVKLPLQMRSLGLAIKAKVLATGRFSFSVSVSDPQGNKLLDANGELNYEGEPGRTIWFPVVMGPALLTTEGPYDVGISLGDGPLVHEAFLVRKTAVPEVRVTEKKPN